MQVVELNRLPRSLPLGHWGVETVSVAEVDALSSVTVQVCEMKPGGGAEMHEHSAARQVFLLLSGELKVTGDGGATISVAADQALVIPASRPHAATNAGAGIARYVVLTMAS